MSEELKPCPFCGGKAAQNFNYPLGKPISYVHCSDCGAARHTAEEWNRRAPSRDAQQEKDAARYRFARDLGCNFVWAVIGAGECRSGLDEAIDARIAALSAQANQGEKA